MTERPMLFQAPMVRAILARSKTQTRRTVKPQPVSLDRGEYKPGDALMGPGGRAITCRYGLPGDRLWVRETCRAHEITDEEARANRWKLSSGRLGEMTQAGLDGVVYLADNTFREIENTHAASEAWCELHAYRRKRGATVPGIHMPRWASRITLGITHVRVERLQDISDSDCLAEGITRRRVSTGDARTGLTDAFSVEGAHDSIIARDCYERLWESINGPGSWDANPWVWVIEFKRLPQ